MDFARFLTSSYNKAFNYSNIVVAFRQAGLWLDEMKLIEKALPLSSPEPNRIVDVVTMCAMLGAKRKLENVTLLAPPRF